MTRSWCTTASISITSLIYGTRRLADMSGPTTWSVCMTATMTPTTHCLNFGFLPTAPPHGIPGRYHGPKKKIVFHCGGFAAAMKNDFFLFFLPRRRRVLGISPPCPKKGQTSSTDGEALEKGLLAAGIPLKESKRALKVEAPHKWRNYLQGVWRRHQHRPEVAALYRSKLIIAEQRLQQWLAAYPEHRLPATFDNWYTQPASAATWTRPCTWPMWGRWPRATRCS